MISPTSRLLALCLFASGLGAQQLITVRGTVYDSLHGGPMKGALVALPNSNRSTVTDSLGRFSLDSVRVGRHLIHVAHEGLDSLGLRVLTADATILPSSPALTLAIPTYRSFWRAACDRPPPGDSVYISGVVRNAATDEPVANAIVRLVWILTAANVDLENRMDGVTATTDENGAYGFCGVPKNANLRLRAATETMESGTFAMPAGKADVRWRDLVVAGAGTDSATLGSVSGVVRQRATGAPVANARVVIDGKLEVRTDSAGRFGAARIQPGTRQVAILSVGVAATSATVDVRPGRSNSVTLQVEQVQTLAAANIITLGPPSPYLRGIMERERTGLGKFMDSTQMVGRHFTRSIFEGQPSLRVMSTRGMRFVILAKDMQSRDCVANVFIDGVRADQEELMDVLPDQIAKVEIYGRGMLTPIEFQTLRSTCGTIVLWTKWKLDRRPPP